MSRNRDKYKSYAKVIGDGETCPKCFILMQRRKRFKPPTTKTYFYTEWDYCPNCHHVQHYDKFKSTAWQEAETQEQFFKDI